MNDIDNITLQYFTNKSQYDNIIKKKGDIIDDMYVKERSFYKKRILDLTKKLFKEGNEEMQLKTIFNGYVKSCINYIKFNDKKEIYQGQYNNENLESLELNMDNIDDISYNNVDYLMCKKETVKTVNLDTYVKKKSNKTTSMIVPKKMEMNIKSKEYKTKGIVVKEKKKKKKKNISNNYEEDKKESS